MKNKNISITDLRTEKGASRFGTCSACGVFSEEAHLYRFTFRISNQGTSLCLCSKCIEILKGELNQVQK